MTFENNNNEFDLEKYVSKEESSEDELLDYTTEFLDLLKRLARKDGFGAIIWIIGTPGSGKSTLMCELDDILLKNSYLKRNVAFYKAPDSLLKEVRKAVPSTLRSKFRNITKLSEVKPYDILNIDEGYLDADAKNALVKDSVNFIASLTTLRHSSVITILNSLDNGILRGYRIKAQMRFYKLLPEGYLNETNDKFAKKYRNYITNLLQEQTIFTISHVDFIKTKIKKGALILPMKKYCSWYNEKISRSFEGENFDARLRRLVKKKLEMEDIIELLIRKFGTDLTKDKAEGFLFDEHIEIFKEFETDIKQIVKTAKYRMWRDKKERDDAFNYGTTELTIPQIISNNDANDACANFFKAYYFNNISFNKHKGSFLAIIYDWILGLPQRKIAYETGISLGTVNNLLQKYNKGEGLDSDLLRTKTVYEFWIAHATNGKRDGSRSKPDVWYFNEVNDVIGCGEDKLIDDVSSTLTFYLESLGHKKNKKMTLEPAYTYCKNHNIQYFPLFLRNPKWANADLIIPIDVYDDNKITVSKALLKEYAQLTVQSFNHLEFFSNQDYVINLLCGKT